MRAVTLGEIMLRLTPPGVKRLAQTAEFEVCYGGAEANVAYALSQFGAESKFVSKVPENGLGDAALNSLRAGGVDTHFVLRGGERLGVYYLERGNAFRAGNVLYDRAGSAFACAHPEEFDWDKIFESADWFHFTGITPALSINAEEITRAALWAAKKYKITVSCDLNYRAKLWDTGRARQVLSSLLKQVDVCIANKHQVAELFGASEEDAAKYLMSNYAFSHVALSARRTLSATRNVVGGSLCAGEAYVSSREYELEMAERVGGGDAFAAGIIYALANNYSLQRAIDLAVACCCMKHTIPGDYCQFSLQEVELLAEGQSFCGVKR